MKMALACASILLMISLGFTGCGDDGGTGSPSATASLVGTWTRSSSTVFTLTLAADNTYSGQFTGGSGIDVSGTYSASGTTITFTDSGGPLACTNNGSFVVGSYTYTITGNTLTFSQASDPCTARDAILTGGAWTKQ